MESTIDPLREQRPALDHAELALDWRELGAIGCGRGVSVCVNGCDTVQTRYVNDDVCSQGWRARSALLSTLCAVFVDAVLFWLYRSPYDRRISA